MPRKFCKIRKRCNRLLRLFKTQNGRCFYCGEEMRFFRDIAKNALPPNYATKDHVFPRALGGKGNIDNLVAACFACNVKKGHSTTVSDN